MFLKDRKKELEELKEAVKLGFKAVKEEFNEHLDSINGNTQEIDVVHSRIDELDSKIEKLNERIDNIYMKMSLVPNFEDVTLTFREQEVFICVYTHDMITYGEIADMLGLTEFMVKNYIASLISKGIPILKQFKENEFYLYLDPEFKVLQAKKNILSINESILKNYNLV